MICNVLYLVLILLVILWFGIDELVKIFLVVFGMLFLIYLNIYYGICGIDFGLLEMVCSYGLFGFVLFCQVILFGVLLLILVGVCFVFGFMWLILIVVEIIFVSFGIGYLVMNVCEFLQIDVVVLVILFYVVFGKFVDFVVCGLECVWLCWYLVYQVKGGGV